MTVRPVLGSTNMANLAVDTEAELSGLLTQTFAAGVQVWSIDSQLLWVWDPNSTAATIAGQSRAVATGGAWLVTGGASVSTALNMNSVLGPAGAGGVGSLRGTIPAGPVTALPKGFETPGDTGGGLWFFDTTSVLADDADLAQHVATVIQPTGLVGAGRWRRIVVQPLGLLGSDISAVGQAIEWQSNVTTPGLQQINNGTGAGAALVMRAQASTNAGSAGGHADVKAGAPGAGGVNGRVRQWIGATDAAAGTNVWDTDLAGGLTVITCPGTSGVSYSLAGKIFGVLASGAGNIQLDTDFGLLRTAGAGNVFVWRASQRGCLSGDPNAVLAGTNGVGCTGVANAGTVPTVNPVGGHVIYSTAGALTGRGSGGTVTTIAPA